MATLAVAALGTAAAAYAYRQALLLDPDRPTVQSHTNQHEAPNTWVEALYFFTETMRYAYSETLGRWRTADLLLGLMYLSRREGDVYPAADIVAQGVPVDVGGHRQEVAAALEEIAVFKRILSLCCVQRLKDGLQEAAWKELGIEQPDILKRFPRAGILRPSFSVLRDYRLKAIVLVVRGTHSLKDMFTCLTSAVKPHHMASPDGVVLGYSHFGMLAAARWILKESYATLETALANNPHLQLLVAGHSLGGGTAAMLTMMLREQHPRFASTRCYTIATPSCMTKELSQSCAAYVTTLMNGADVVPTFSPATMDRLREEVAASHWYDDLRQSSLILRTVEGGLRGVGCATRWTARSLVWGATIPVHAMRQTRACVAARRRAVPGSPAPMDKPHSDQDVLRPEASATGYFRGSVYSNTVPPEVAPEDQNLSLHRRRGLLCRAGGSRGRSAWALVNPTAWFAECRGMGPSPQQQPAAPQLLATQPSIPAALGRRRSSAWGDDWGSDGDTRSILADFDLESVNSLALSDEAVQQFEDEITECVEELQNNPDNSVKDGLTDLMEAVAQAEHEEVREQETPRMAGTLGAPPAFSLHATPEKPLSSAEAGARAFGDDGGNRDTGTLQATGSEGASGRPGWEARRHMFPPGRILHLAPRQAVPAVSAAEQLGEYAAQQFSHCAGSLDLELWANGMAAATAPSGGARGADAEELPSSSRARTTAGPEVPPGQAQWDSGSPGGPVRYTPPPSPGRGAQAVHSRSDDFMGKPGWGQGVGCGQETAGSEVDTEEFMVFRDIPQEAYGRMKVCPQMLRDHVLPAYLRALDSVQGQLAASLEGTGRPQDYIERLPDWCFRVPRD